MLISRYGTSVLDLDLRYGIQLIKKAYEKETDKKIWEMWLSLYPNMDKEHFVSFKDYKNSIIGNPEKPKVRTKNKEEIYAQADKILAAFNKSKGGKI